MLKQIPDIIGNGNFINLDIAMSAVSKAITNGCDRRLLRWRVSPAQACAMLKHALSTAMNPAPPFSFLETGAAYESGIFCGIPFAVDSAVPPDTILLERLEPMPLMTISDLALPMYFGEP